MRSSKSMIPGGTDTAVLVIDAQVGLLESVPPPQDKDAVLARIASVIAKARRARVPVIFLQHDGDPDGKWLRPFSEAWKLHPALDMRLGDAVIRKRYCDAFHGTRLAAQLRRWGIRTVVLLGYATEFCVDSTVRRATSRGLRVVVVRDGHTTNDSPVLSARQIIAHHNQTWMEMDCFPKVMLVSARTLKFQRGASRMPGIRK